jgi:hypothetical protein
MGFFRGLITPTLIATERMHWKNWWIKTCEQRDLYKTPEQKVFGNLKEIKALIFSSEFDVKWKDKTNKGDETISSKHTHIKLDNGLHRWFPGGNVVRTCLENLSCTTFDLQALDKELIEKLWTIAEKPAQRWKDEDFRDKYNGRDPEFRQLNIKCAFLRFGLDDGDILLRKIMWSQDHSIDLGLISQPAKLLKKHVEMIKDEPALSKQHLIPRPIICAFSGCSSSWHRRYAIWEEWLLHVYQEHHSFVQCPIVDCDAPLLDESSFISHVKACHSATQELMDQFIGQTLEKKTTLEKVEKFQCFHCQRRFEASEKPSPSDPKDRTFTAWYKFLHHTAEEMRNHAVDARTEIQNYALHDNLDAQKETVSLC